MAKPFNAMVCGWCLGCSCRKFCFLGGLLMFGIFGIVFRLDQDLVG
jgi:hypothetical protein